MTYRKRKSIRTAILALASAAILVPAAQAHTDFGSSGNGGTNASSADPYAYLPQADRQAIVVGQGSTTSSVAQSSGYSPQALTAMGERYTKMAEAYLASSSGYSPQALQAIGDWYLHKTAAFQATRPDDRSGVHGVGQTTVTSDYVDRQVANLEAKSGPVVHVDDRAGVRGPGPVETPVVVTTHDGFNWTDAGIGGAAMLFVAALIAAALMARRRPSIAV